MRAETVETKQGNRSTAGTRDYSTIHREPAYNPETEMSASLIFSSSKIPFIYRKNVRTLNRRQVENKKCITMSTFGELGRFGNQLLQYMSLVTLAETLGLEIQVPWWMGEPLFALDDSRIEQRLPIVFDGLYKQANCAWGDDYYQYLKEREPLELIYPSILLKKKLLEQKVVNRDLVGWFQWHTSVFRPHRKEIFHRLKCASPLKERLDKLLKSVIGEMEGACTLIGLHIRLGDYKEVSWKSFAYYVPLQWYKDWLAQIYSSAKNPIVFIASDELSVILQEFEDYNVITCNDFGSEISYLCEWNAEFFVDGIS
eukprot:jgi/Galph1/1203/GphlegSOOS_G5996.1